MEIWVREVGCVCRGDNQLKFLHELQLHVQRPQVERRLEKEPQFFRGDRVRIGVVYPSLVF